MDQSQDAHAGDAVEAKDSPTVANVRTQQYNSSNETMVPTRPDAADQAQAHAEDLSIDDASSKAADDSLSVHSTSSRSFFRSPLMRKRVADRSVTDKERTRRASRTSSLYNDDDASGLGASLALEIQKQGKPGGQWGIGDEARMSLE